MEQDRQLLFLKNLVKIMGVILVIGVIFVIATLIARSASKSFKIERPSEIKATAEDYNLDVENLNIDGEYLDGFEQNGQILLLFKDKQNKFKVIKLK